MEKIPQAKEKKFEKIDRKSPEIRAMLQITPLYRKFGNVHARRASAGEQITTTLADGRNETINTANESDWIVTNPDGEQYIISETTFLSRYESTDQSSMYSAKGYCKAIKNPFGKPIQIMASWGSPQTGDENCLIADVCDQEGNLNNEPYIIDQFAFQNTYKPYK